VSGGTISPCTAGWGQLLHLAKLDSWSVQIAGFKWALGTHHLACRLEKSNYKFQFSEQQYLTPYQASSNPSRTFELPCVLTDRHIQIKTEPESRTRQFLGVITTAVVIIMILMPVSNVHIIHSRCVL